MNDTGKIVWLASYPKSGNTWFRVFITAILSPASPSVDINNLHPTTIASSRRLFEELTGISSADLSRDEIDRLRPLVYRKNAMEADDIIYHKIHDAYTILPGGEPLITADVTKAVLYFIRNPLDVVISFAHHLNSSIDSAIDIMNNPEYAFCQRTDKLCNQLYQKLLTWSGHVKSWIDDSGLPVLVLRYEDMSALPVETFSKALKFIGLKYTSNEIDKALEVSSFTRLKQQEEEKGFHEKNPVSVRFFRKGVIGEWHNVLTKNQVNRILEAHGTVMERFGYLSGDLVI